MTLPKPLRRAAAVLLALAGVGAAEQPLGTVTARDGERLEIRFDRLARPEPGSMLGLWGPGPVRRHPLTNEVIVEQRRLTGRAQVLSEDAGRVTARLVWSADDGPAPGHDAIPTPGEAAPNGVPALRKPMDVQATAPRSRLELALPVQDPDGDPLWCRFRLDGPPGRSGVLSHEAGPLPRVAWLAPAGTADATLVADIVDRLGQRLELKIALRASGNAPEPAPTVLGRLGSARAAVDGLARDGGDGWILRSRNRLLRADAGQWQEAALELKSPPERPVDHASHGDELLVLDAGLRQVVVYGPDGAVRRRLTGLAEPTALAVAGDGSVFVADQGLGGVAVFEADGSWRCRLGRPGDDEQGFSGLVDVTVDADGACWALDARAGRILRFDRRQRRLPAWPVQTDSRNPAVAIALHPAGVLTLLANGRLLLTRPDGSPAAQASAEPSLSRAADGARATALVCDPDGTAWTVWAERGLVGRHGADLAPRGWRGPTTLPGAAWAFDGEGRLWGVDEDSRRLRRYGPGGFLLQELGADAQGRDLIRRGIAVAVAEQGGCAVVVDRSARTALRFDLAGDPLAPRVLGQRGNDLGQFEDPVAAAMDEQGRIYILDNEQCRISVFDAEGRVIFAFGERGSAAGQLRDPTQLAVSSDGGIAYVYDDSNSSIRKFAIDHASRSGKAIGSLGSNGSGNGQFRSLVALGVNRAGLLLAADSSRDDLQILDFRGQGGVMLRKITAAELGLDDLSNAGFGPDGLVILGDGSQHVVLRY
jgi:sugar lactone lactonase YvrE